MAQQMDPRTQQRVHRMWVRADRAAKVSLWMQIFVAALIALPVVGCLAAVLWTALPG